MVGLEAGERLRTMWHFQREQYDRLLGGENHSGGRGKKEEVRCSLECKDTA
jgi:hypothetical protein